MAAWPPAVRSRVRLYDRPALMAGMARATGAALDGLDHIRQSVADILGTPVGSRICRREYGSLLPELIDQPLTAATVLRIYAATATAIARHEPRLRLTRVSLAPGAAPGSATLTLEGERTDVPASAAATRLALTIQRQAIT